jgi:hypothetical protein
MTENKEKPGDTIAVHKITGNRVEIGLAEFIDMCNAVRAAKDTEEANEWLRKARQSLLEELQYTKENATPRAPTQITVYRRAPNGSLHVQFIEGMQQGHDGTIYVTIGEPQ